MKGNDLKNTILLVDDEKNMRSSLKRMFEEESNIFTVFEAASGEEACELIEENFYDIVLMDVKMAGISGLEALEKIKKNNPKQIVIIMTGCGNSSVAIEAMKLGAFDYILKPFKDDDFWKLINNALYRSKVMQNDVIFNDKKIQVPTKEAIIGSSDKMQEVYKLIGQISSQDVTVLIRGESGTGKELIARAIYHNSNRKDQPYLAINSAAIPETLLESELFGHEKGAFTGAENLRIGKFEQCNGGTIFLDEIGDIPLSIQSKILRAIQEKEITRLGSNDPIQTNIRLILATNKNLEDAILKKEFREDLYYRINVVSINIPSLRDHKEDIPELVDYFLHRSNDELNKRINGLHAKALEKLKNYDWPGNVRELENVIKSACLLSKGSYIFGNEIALFSSPKIISKEDMSQTGILNEDLDFNVLMDLLYKKCIEFDESEAPFSIIEKELLKRVLLQTEGNQMQASKILKMDRNTIRNKIEKYEIKINKSVSI